MMLAPSPKDLVCIEVIAGKVGRRRTCCLGANAVLG